MSAESGIQLLGWLLAASLLIAIAVHRIAAWLRRGADARVRAERLRHAYDSEERAIALLEEWGFTLVDSQVSRDWVIHVDDEPVEILLRCDHLVERDGERFVAEVKTGVMAPDIRNAATRRQLLEYRVAFDVDGVLLVDMECGEVRLVHFHV